MYDNLKQQKYEKVNVCCKACAMGLSGCSSEDDCATNPEPAGDVTEIKLSAGIQGVATRSPVSTNDNITAPFVASATTGDYTTNAWSSTVTFVASPTTDSRTLFQPGTVLSDG